MFFFFSQFNCPTHEKTTHDAGVAWFECGRMGWDSIVARNRRGKLNANYVRLVRLSVGFVVDVFRIRWHSSNKAFPAHSKHSDDACKRKSACLEVCVSVCV